MKVGEESEKLEFKRSTAELNEGIISIVAMLNKHSYGELYFGVRNDGTPMGMDISEKTLRDVSQAITNHIEPQIYPEIKQVFIEEKACIHIGCTGEETPYYAFGRAYVRIADEDRVLSPAELESYILKRNIGRKTWDSDLSEKTIDDIDEDTLKKYLERANRAKRIDFVYTTKEDTLRRLNLIEGNKLKNAAYVLFGKLSMLEVQMAIFAGTERLTFNDIKRESGNVIALVEVTEKYIRNNIHWRVVLDGSVQRKEIPEVPIEAIREALVNSYCHRLYTSSQNNEVTIYSDRVEIYNPGTFPDGLTPQDFIEGYERSVKRNPLLAQLMYYSRDVESFGTGLKRITVACKNVGITVKFELLKKGFAVVFYRPSEQVVTTKIRPNVVRNVVRNEMEEAVLSTIAKNPAVTAAQIAVILSKSNRTIQRYLNSLQKKKVIRRVGSTKRGYWEITNNNKDRVIEV
ncbi:MAG: putative DNA binding domain-containing protein [Nitrososphaerota archaeon]|nr:putative DNA binding domain-containing protein [Nitrososphaerota archaeon]